MVFCGCSGGKSKNGYSIGVDPTWYPLEVAGREKNVLGFSVELLQEISKRQKLNLTIVQMNWDNLLEGLKGKKYQAILSALPPYAFYGQEYTFSETYLMTGPVIVTPLDSKIDSLESLKDKEVGVMRRSAALELVQKVPGVVVREFDSVPEALNALENGHIQCALIDSLVAKSYVRDLFATKLKVTSTPLIDEGLRLITLFDMSPKLIEKFNKGLEEMKTSGAYTTLLQKWSLN